MPRQTVRTAGMLSLLLWLPGLAADAAAQEPAGIDVRPPIGIVYVIGSVDRVVKGAAVIDLGDVHTLDTATLDSEKTVAVFRPQDNFFKPVGTLQLAETFDSYSTAKISREFQPQPEDLVIFVRELSELRTADDHLEHVVTTRALRAARRNAEAAPRRQEAVSGLLDYRERHQQWVRNLGNEPGQVYVLGRLYGSSLRNGSTVRVDQLISQIDLLRELHQDGLQAVAAGGDEWSAVMPVLHGPSVRQQVESQAAVVEQQDTQYRGPDFIRDARRVVYDVLFDRPEEIRNILASLIVSRIQRPRGNDNLWFQIQLPQTQFPGLATDDQILEDIRVITRRLRSGS